MASRRDFLKTGALAGAGVLLAKRGTEKAFAAAGGGTPQIKKWMDPLITAIPTLSPNAGTYTGADYYEIYMQGGRWQFHSQLPVTAVTPFTTWGYGSGAAFLGYLGPTIEATRGRAVVVKYINNLSESLPHPLQSAIDPTVPDPIMYPGLVPGRATPHLHGGFTAPGFDGHPHSWWTAGVLSQARGTHYASLPGAGVNEAIYVYSNQQPAAMLWYHDHAMGITRLNAYAGLAALYFVRDDYDTGKPFGTPGLPATALNLPAGPYEIPLVIQDKQFNPDGSLFYPTVGISPTHPIWVPEFFGDTPVVNARAYPFLNVQPRRYRFRIVNGSQARFYNLFLAGKGMGNLPIWVIGMEQSLLPAAVSLQQLLIGPGERADVIIDFTGFKPGTTFMLSNNAKTPYPGGGGKPGGPIMPDILKINVVAAPAGTPPDATTPPASLVLPAIDPIVQNGPSREIVMKETMDPLLMVPLEVRLNERWFDEAVEETPMVNDVETWQYINLTVDAHPMHSHLVKFKVVNRQAFNALTYTTAYLAWVAAGRIAANKPVLANYLVGQPLPPAPEESGWKDTAKSYPGQVLRVMAKYEVPAADPNIPGSDTVLPAEYVYHCHILEHEENEMMRPFAVTASGSLPKTGGEEGEEIASTKPLQFGLEQNYPNPFNPETTIRFSLPQDANVQLKVFNSIGQEVATLADGSFNAGAHAVTFNANNLASGAYYAKIQAGAFSAVKKMLLVR